ncbi:MAG: CARDB domain-containing protein [Candidatus Nanohalobium sp.]
MRKHFLLLAVLGMAFLGGATVEIGPGVRIFQYDQPSNINFSQPQNYSFIGVRSLRTDFGSTNFTVSPKSDAAAELDFLRPLAGRQSYVSNFTAFASPSQHVSFNITDLPSSDFYEAFFSDNGSRIFIGYADSPDDMFNFSAKLQNVDISIFNYGEKGVEAENISFNDTNPVEDNTLKVEANISNEGVVDPESPNTTVKIETFNGTRWVFRQNISTVDTVPVNGSVLANVSWTVKPGPWRFTSVADPEDEIKETNESNNQASEILNVDSYQILYGESNSSLVLGAGNREIYSWNPGESQGNLFFYDADASFDYGDLEPVNSSDLVELDEALRMRGHNDSIQELWDDNGDGSIDRFESMKVGDRTLSVPVTNTTADSPFDTGILYDSGDGTGFDGSQDLVFVTELKFERTGKYGTYDYEVRLPFYLGDLRAGVDKVSVDFQLT